jgi:hypothetical protein
MRGRKNYIQGVAWWSCQSRPGAASEDLGTGILRKPKIGKPDLLDWQLANLKENEGYFLRSQC